MELGVLSHDDNKRSTHDRRFYDSIQTESTGRRFTPEQKMLARMLEFAIAGAIRGVHAPNPKREDLDDFEWLFGNDDDFMSSRSVTSHLNISVTAVRNVVSNPEKALAWLRRFKQGKTSDVEKIMLKRIQESNGNGNCDV
jgi:hypothetical protein